MASSGNEGPEADPVDVSTRRMDAPSAKPGSRTAQAVPPDRKEAPDNSILPHRARTRKREAVDLEKVSTAPPPAATTSSQPTGQSTADPWTIPASVRDRFTQEGHRFYFSDGARAFQDHGRKLSTASENVELIRSLVEVAKARGWDTVVVKGTERFREQAWREARLEGLTVRGYSPSDQERVALSRTLARRHSAPDDAPPVDPERAAEPERESRPRREAGAAIIGKLLDHGRETYQFDPHAEISYFVRIQSPEGKQTLWGKDLQRAIDESLTQPKIGEEVTLKRTGSDNVTVKRRERDAEGAIVTERDLDTKRNRWVIEKREFFDERESAAAILRDTRIQPKAAVQTHPQLAGSYLNLHAAEIAAKVLPDTEDQKKFVALVRTALADAVERGDPLQPVRLRERVQSRGAERTQREPEAPAR